MHKITPTITAFILSFAAYCANAHNLLQVYEMAYHNDPTYKAAETDYLAAREAFPQARANLLPSLTLDGEIARSKRELDEGDTLNTSSYTLTLSQRIFHLNDWFALKGASYSVKRAAAIFAASQQDLMLRVATAYFDILAAQDDLSFALVQKKQLGEQLHQTKERFKVGVVAITDVKEAQSRYDSARATAIGQENELANRQEELRAIIQLEPGVIDRLQETIPLVRPSPQNMAAWVSTAERQDYDLIAARYAVKAAKQNKYEQYAGHMPTVTFTSNFQGRDENFQRAQSATPFAKSWSVALQGSVPIFSGFGVQSRARQASYQHLSAMHNYELAHRTTLNNTRNAYRGILTSISQVHALHEAVQSAETALEATKAGFSVGTKTNVDVLDRISDLFQQRQRYSAARYAYVLNTLQLKREAGILSVPDLEQINRWLIPHKVRRVRKEEPTASTKPTDQPSNLHKQQQKAV